MENLKRWIVGYVTTKYTGDGDRTIRVLDSYDKHADATAHLKNIRRYESWNNARIFDSRKLEVVFCAPEAYEGETI